MLNLSEFEMFTLLRDKQCIHEYYAGSFMYVRSRIRELARSLDWYGK